MESAFLIGTAPSATSALPRAALGLVLAVAVGCASYSVGSFDREANPDLTMVILARAHPNPVGTPIATLETKKRGGRDCTDLGNAALRDLLSQAKTRDGVGVKDVEFRGRSKWIGKVACRDSTFGRSTEVRGVAYSLGEPVSIPGPLSIRLPKGMRPEFTEVAVLAATVDEPIPAWVTTYVKPASHPLAALKEKLAKRRPGSGWFVTSRESGRIVADYRQEPFHLRVLVTYDREAATARIAGSKNLGQTSSHISAEAATRYRDFVARLQATLGDLAARG